MIDLVGVKRVEKLWGYEEWLVNSELYCAKRLVIYPGRESSIHYHKVKQETFCVVSGIVRLQQWEKNLDDFPSDETLIKDDQRTIMPKTPHRFSAVGYNNAVILEVSTHHDDADVVRIAESRLL